MPRYGIVLLPHPPMDAELVAYAQELCAQSRSTHHTLNNVDRLAHATLLHAEGNESDAFRWWAAAQPDLPASVSLELCGLNIQPPDVDDDTGVMFWLSINGTPQLRTLYDGVYRRATEHNMQPAGYFADKFIPHFTLGAVDALPDRRLLLNPRCTTGTLTARPALAAIRDRGSVRRILATFLQ